MILFLKNYRKGITILCIEMCIGCILAYSDTDIIEVVQHTEHKMYSLLALSV